jgi:hypothetical protein
MARIALIALLSFCLVLTGCTSMRTVPLAATSGIGVGKLKPGDTVRFTMRTGEVRWLKLSAVEADTLTGKYLDSADPTAIVQVAVADIQSLQVKKVSWVRSVGAGLGVVAAVFVGLVLAVVLKCGYINGEDKCSD